MKPLLLGEAPGRGTLAPLTKSAKRLCLFAGWVPEVGEDYRATLARRFELRNLLTSLPEKNGKGRAFDPGEARRAAQSLPLAERTVVALGKRVAEAVGAPEDYFLWRLDFSRSCVLVTVPHPSGVNQVLNDPEIRRRTGEVLRVAAASE